MRVSARIMTVILVIAIPFTLTGAIAVEKVANVAESSTVKQVNQLEVDKRVITKTSAIPMQFKKIVKKPKKLTFKYDYRVGSWFYVNRNVTSRSNVTVKELEGALKGFGAKRAVKAAVKMEREKGINALFTIGVGITESGWHMKNGKRAKKYGNAYGMMGKANTRKLGVPTYTKIFAGKIKKYYVNRGATTPSRINRSYCPPNKEWKNNVARTMATLHNKIVENKRKHK